MAKATGRTRNRRSIRLTSDVRPTEVDLHVELDPQRSARFSGEVHLDLELAGPQRELEVHAVDLEVRDARVACEDGDLKGRIEPCPERETLVVKLPRVLPAGRARLSLRFRGRLRKDLKGLYAASVDERRYAFTQLEATDARRFFPCLDEPDKKARFTLHVTTATRNTVLANAPEARTEAAGPGRKTVHFEPTPPLSSYLVALAVGELEGSRTVRAGSTPIRIWHVPGKQGLTGFALEAARECLTRLERYFALPYPYAKLDLVAVPDFEFGAMENAGAVFFRETLLLIDPKTVTLGESKRAAEVICHELAHMWYGDLVTMAWWDDLWLNEAFATWMAFAVVDAWKPEWKMWHDFEHHRAAAFDLDALSNTHPIYCDVATPEEATENFDLITYEKGASVVRMIERYLGPAVFRKGVRRYIRRHREGNARAADLWRALSEAAGQDVEPVAKAWIEQAGYPRVDVRRRKVGRRVELELVQHRFHAQPARTAAKKRARRADPRWPIPWVGRVGARGRRGREVRQLLERRRERVRLPAGAADFVYGNADEGGFFRPLHAPEELARLAGSLRSLRAVERMGLLRHTWAGVRSGVGDLGAYLDLAGAFARESDPDVLQALSGGLSFLDRQLGPAVGAAARDRFRVWIIDTFSEQLVRLGWERQRDDADETRLRRAAIIALLGGTAEWAPVLRSAEERAPRYVTDRGSLDANLADAAVSLAARGGDAALHAAFREAARDSETPQERRRFLMALADFRDPRCLERTLRMSVTRAVPTQDVALLLARALGNEAGRERAWAFVREQWPKLLQRMPSMLATRIIEATPALQSPAHRREVASFFRAHPVPTGARTLKQALERFDHNSAFRRREAKALRAWLDGLPPRA